MNIARECGTASQAPSIVEIVVRVTSTTQLYYILGASVAGFETNKDFSSKVVQHRRVMLLNEKFLKGSDLDSPPQRILTLLEHDGRNIRFGDPAKDFWI